MSTEVYMVEGDTAPTRDFTILRDGAAVDLTGAIVKFIIVDTSTFAVTNADHQTCALNADPMTGKVEYTFQNGDIASANAHFGDLQVAYAGGLIETDFDRVIIRVRPKAATVS